MNDFLDLLTRHANGDAPRLAEQLDRACSDLAGLLAGCEPNAREEILARFRERLGDRIRRIEAATAGGQRHSPEFLAWARSQVTEEELVAGIREIETTGGLTFDEVIADLDPPVPGDE